MYEYRQIIYRLRKGQSNRSISKETAFGRDKISAIKRLSKVQGWLSDGPLPVDNQLNEIINAKLGSNDNSTRRKCAGYEEQINQWVDNGVSAVIIHSHLVKHYNFAGSYNSIQRYVKLYKESQGIKMTVPMHFEPGECAQVDFGAGPKLLDERSGEVVKTWYFVMTLCWSRHQYAQLITHQDISTWLLCHRNAFEWFGGVVNKVMIDNAKCAVTKASYDNPEIQRSYNEFAENYGFIISACPPRDPQKKGRVESGVKYIKGNFAPLRHFKSLQDANRQLESWILEDAGNRKHGSTFEKPLTQFDSIERQFLNPLPKTKVEIASWHKVKQYRDCHIRFEKVRYSVPHNLYGKPLWLKATASMVQLYNEIELVATHTRSRKAGECKTINEHLPPQAQYYFERTPEWCLVQSLKIGVECHSLVENLLTDPTRDLLRQAQKVLRLKDKYCSKRLEKACHRANSFHSSCYETVANILKTGLDYQSLTKEQAFEKLSPVYIGYGKYQRHSDKKIH